jgi:hypothetical protein
MRNVCRLGSLFMAAVMTACIDGDPNVLGGGYNPANGYYGTGNQRNCDGRSPDASTDATPHTDDAAIDAPPPTQDASADGITDAPWSPDDAGSDATVEVGDAGLPPPTCSLFTYSAFGPCMPGNTQTRTVVSEMPAGCTGGSPALQQACTYVAPVSFAVDVQPIFTAHCALTGCHGGTTPVKPKLTAGATYVDLVNIASAECAGQNYVVPSHDEQSWLIAKVTANATLGTCVGGGMATYLPASADREKIVTWIRQGAQNN